MKRFRSPVIVAIVAVLSAVLLSPEPAQADQETKIYQCPFVISVPGEYLLKNDVICPVGTAFTITASDVHFDLGGHTIDGGPNFTGGVGIAVLGATNVHINNGTVEHFMAFNADGILLIDAGGNHLDDLTLTENFDGLGFSHANGNRIESSDLSSNSRWGAEVSLSDANEFQGNTANGNGYAGYALSAAHDNLISSGKIVGNTIVGVGLGVLGVANRNVVSSNEISDNGDGIEVLQGAGNLVESNQVLENSTRGIVVFPGASSHVIESNTARGNGLFDLEDDNPNCDSNVWQHNNFETANQPSCID
jgi:parallel beta-helix repeat protein